MNRRELQTTLVIVIYGLMMVALGYFAGRHG